MPISSGDTQSRAVFTFSGSSTFNGPRFRRIGITFSADNFDFFTNPTGDTSTFRPAFDETNALLIGQNPPPFPPSVRTITGPRFSDRGDFDPTGKDTFASRLISPSLRAV